MYANDNSAFLSTEEGREGLLRLRQEMPGEDIGELIVLLLALHTYTGARRRWREGKE